MPFPKITNWGLRVLNGEEELLPGHNPFRANARRTKFFVEYDRMEFVVESDGSLPHMDFYWKRHLVMVLTYENGAYPGTIFTLDLSETPNRMQIDMVEES